MKPIRRFVVSLAVVCAASWLFAGCSLDPMEQLTEDMNQQDAGTRVAAVTKLANLKDPRATDALIQALDSDDMKVHGTPETAAPAAGATAAPIAGEAAKKATGTPKAETPAKSAPASETPLAAGAGETANPDVTIGDLAGVALVKKGRERTTKQKPDPLLDAIAKVMGNLHTSEANRARAAWTLGEIGDRMAIPALKTAQAGAKTAGGADALLVRQAAQEALEKLGYDTNGRDYEMDKGKLSGELSVIPIPKKIALPPPPKPA